jgi:hypothetical protein
MASRSLRIVVMTFPQVAVVIGTQTIASMPGIFPRRRDAERWLASQEVAIARGEWVDPTLSKITVGEWSPQWLARQVQLKPTTMVR